MLTQARLHEMFSYDPETGAFTRLVSRAGNAKAGDVAGTRHPRGYWQINVDGKLYLSHRLAWLYVTGEWPKTRIVFKNGDKSDARWENIRESGKEPKLTAERVRELLDYDADTGIFRYRRNRGNGIRKGEVAGTNWRGNGYTVICVDQHFCGAHQLAWLHVTGTWPPQEVDHINTDRADNRFCNLRLASRSENLGNRARQANNTSGFKGVSFSKAARRWVASLQKEGTYYYLGLHDTPEAAHDAYCRAAKDVFGEFARVN
jgi:hypothetical protein